MELTDSCQPLGISIDFTFRIFLVICTFKLRNCVPIPAAVAWSVEASFQIQVEMDFAGGGWNPA